MHCERLFTLIYYWQLSVCHIIELTATHIRILRHSRTWSETKPPFSCLL